MHVKNNQGHNSSNSSSNIPSYQDTTTAALVAKGPGLALQKIDNKDINILCCKGDRLGE